jgi:hypothetical protein
VIFVHFLFLDDVDAARESLSRLERLVVGAIGTDDEAPERPTSEEELS